MVRIDTRHQILRLDRQTECETTATTPIALQNFNIVMVMSFPSLVNQQGSVVGLPGRIICGWSWEVLSFTTNKHKKTLMIALLFLLFLQQLGFFRH